MTSSPPPAYERSARRDWRVLGMLGVGVVFAWAGSVIDPQANCSEAGECAPWLVPIAKWMGIALVTSAAGLLWVNPRRGSGFDPATGELVWWQRRLAGHEGDVGRIDPARIGVIRIVRQSESSDAVHLYDLDGARQHYFDEEVIPWPYERWAERLAQAWPQIRVEVVDG